MLVMFESEICVLFELGLIFDVIIVSMIVMDVDFDCYINLCL